MLPQIKMYVYAIQSIQIPLSLQTDWNSADADEMPHYAVGSSLFAKVLD